MLRASVLVLLVLAEGANACTTILAGRLATIDGSVLCTHSNDGEGAIDPRLVHIPAADHAAGAKRPIYYAVEEWPRYVGHARGAKAYYRSLAGLRSHDLGCAAALRCFVPC